MKHTATVTPVSLSLSELAERLKADYKGAPETLVERVVHPFDATSASDMALVLDKAIATKLPELNIKTALLPKGLELPFIPNQILVDRPKVALALLLEWFDKPVFTYPNIHPTAYVDPTADLADDVAIGPFCWVGPNARLGQGVRLVSHVSIGQSSVLGDQCLLHPGVRIGDRVQLGRRVICQPNATIGSDGYSYVTEQVGSVETARSKGNVSAENTTILRINSIGSVILEDEVEVGANCCIDRATLGNTVIKQGTKIDNLAQIAHNVTIGENCFIVAQVGISGSAHIGNRVVIAGQAGIPDHVNIGDDAIITAKCGVTQDVPAKTILVGAPGLPRKEFLQKEMNIKQIKGLVEKVRTLQMQVAHLEAQVLESPEEAVLEVSAT